MADAMQDEQQAPARAAARRLRRLREKKSALKVTSNCTVYDPGHKAMLIFIPKAACTILKATVVMNSPMRERYAESGLTIHRFVTVMRPRKQFHELFQDPDVFRWTVLRDPYRRLLSAYLNKIVGGGRGDEAKAVKVEAIRGAQALQGRPFNLKQGISFEEFVRYLATITNDEMNIHWTPQSHIIGGDLSRFAHVGRLENLKATLKLLEQRFGYRPELDAVPHLGGAEQHSTKYSEQVVIPEPWRRPPHLLRKSELGVPPVAQFYPPELRKIVQERYADDFALYAAVAAREEQVAAA